jgi:hypothetical protein
MAFHLGPTIELNLEKHAARLSWPTPDGTGSAELTLPSGLQWTAYRSELDPMLGWYSERFGVKQPTTTLLGVGRCGPDNRELHSDIQL